MNRAVELARSFISLPPEDRRLPLDVQAQSRDLFVFTSKGLDSYYNTIVQEVFDNYMGGGVTKWLKEGETVIQRLEREREDCTSTLKLYADEKAKVAALETKLKFASGALEYIGKTPQHPNRPITQNIEVLKHVAQEALEQMGVYER